MAERLVVLSIPQLRRRDVTPGALASLESLSRRGTLVDLVPAFPGLAASSFATLVTGVSPRDHGIVGDTYYDRAAGVVAARPLPDSAVTATKLWERLRQSRPGARTLLWFAPNSHGAEVEIMANLDGGTTLATRPEGLGSKLVGRFGPYPTHPEGSEPPRLEAMAWLLATAGAVIAEERPELSLVRVPYLGQVARRFGPDGREAGRSVRTFEAGPAHQSGANQRSGSATRIRSPARGWSIPRAARWTSLATCPIPSPCGPAKAAATAPACFASFR